MSTKIGKIEAKLNKMGLEVPSTHPYPSPNRTSAVQVGNLLFLSGHGTGCQAMPLNIKQYGKVGGNVIEQEAYISAPDDDAYVARSRTASDRVFRIVCGDTWWQIDGSDGRIIEKLDTSRRVYRWVVRALHTLDFPALVERPVLRSGLILLLCGGGFCFSLTGVVIGWRRLKRGG